MEKSDFINLIYSYREKQFSIMLKSYKYRMYPTDNQKEMLSNIFGQVRFVYNLGLCRSKHDRDINAAKNIRNFGLRNQPSVTKSGWLHRACDVETHQSLADV